MVYLSSWVGILTAMDSSPGCSCFRRKFSSANDLVPYMHVLPVPSPLRKSPPWHMKLGIFYGSAPPHPI
jgi:hypothetical protein